MENTYELKYLNLLAKEYKTVQEVSTELINLTAILNLPKGTEHFISDIHGEYETFNHFLKNGSGVIRGKIDIIYPNLSVTEKNTLAFFIYYPKQMVIKYKEKLDNEAYSPFIREQLIHLIEISKYVSQKYTKSKIRKSLPKSFAYIIQELLYESSSMIDKKAYYNAILDAIFNTKRERSFLIELSYFIQRLTIDRLHIVGDIFDRGPNAHLVLNKILKYHSVDIEWGNHDVLWMGAASGSEVSICNVLRISSRYNTLDTLEEGYGINLLPLATFASKFYGDDPCISFLPKNGTLKIDKDKELLVAKMHKAISIMQFKLEHKVIKRNPHFNLENRLLLDKIDYKNNIITIHNKIYKLNDTNFPTINSSSPYELTKEESDIIHHLREAFLNNDLLQTHVKFLFQNGAMHLKYNNNLLFHGCIPLNDDGTFSSLVINNEEYQGKSLFDNLDKMARVGYLNRYNKTNIDKDYFVFLWQGGNSPLFGKKAMKTFERYFINDKISHKEEKNNYFLLREDETILKMIYKEFGIDYNTSKIINGHVPNDISVGDRPILAGGRIYAIDGGMSKQYMAKISIGGYTLVSDSYMISLISHERFTSKNKLIEQERDIISIKHSRDMNLDREYMYNTDKGVVLQDNINDLYKLLGAYRTGLIKEKLK